ncbi:MAG: SHOCT domain-containing protein [Blastocatellales bacterium]
MQHMNYDGWWFWGMHAFWWFFWLLIIVVFFWLTASRSGERESNNRETPLELLQRRYAAGEITTEEYEERKIHLKQDK